MCVGSLENFLVKVKYEHECVRAYQSEKYYDPYAVINWQEATWKFALALLPIIMAQTWVLFRFVYRPALHISVLNELFGVCVRRKVTLYLVFATIWYLAGSRIYYHIRLGE